MKYSIRLNDFWTHLSTLKVLKQTFCVISIIVVVYFLVIFRNNTQNSNILNNPAFVFKVFSEPNGLENSKVTFTKKNSREISYTYHLKEYSSTERNGILIEKTNHSYLDLRHSKILLGIFTDAKQNLPISILNQESNKSLNNKTVNEPQKVYALDSGYNFLEIDFENHFFAKKLNKKLNSNSEPLDNSEVIQLLFLNDPTITSHEIRKYTITHFELKSDSTINWIQITLIITVCFSIFLFYQYSVLTKNKRKNIEPIEQINETSVEEHLIKKFMLLNFSKSKLKAADLAEFLKIPEYRLGEELKEVTTLNFKSYLNQNRVDGAKELLKNSNLSISEIAYKTGFNSPSSFNRVFKEFTHQAPSEFREMSRKKEN